MAIDTQKFFDAVPHALGMKWLLEVARMIMKGVAPRQLPKSAKRACSSWKAKRRRACSRRGTPRRDGRGGRHRDRRKERERERETRGTRDAETAAHREREKKTETKTEIGADAPGPCLST